MQFFLIENRRTEFALRVLFQYNGVWENKIEYGHCVVSASFFFFLKVFQPYAKKIMIRRIYLSFSAKVLTRTIQSGRSGFKTAMVPGPKRDAGNPAYYLCAPSIIG